jgi:glutamine amidotransferase
LSKPVVAVLDYGIGNLRSAQKALEHVGADARLTADPAEIRAAAGVVLPGVGAFGRCMDALRDAGLDVLAREAATSGRPFFGICVGMQLMAERGREYEVTDGLGWIAGEVDKIAPSDLKLKIPHMGWNTLGALRPHPLLTGIPLGPQGLHAYFVHSYELKATQPLDLVAQADYGGPITAIVGQDNIVGTQFHPEKSQRLGLALIANFLKWKP